MFLGLLFWWCCGVCCFVISLVIWGFVVLVFAWRLLGVCFCLIRICRFVLDDCCVLRVDLLFVGFIVYFVVVFWLLYSGNGFDLGCSFWVLLI